MPVISLAEDLVCERSTSKMVSTIDFVDFGEDIPDICRSYAPEEWEVVCNALRF